MKRRYPSTDQLQKMFDASPDVICTFDATYHFLEVNKAALPVWGYEPEELIGQHLSLLVITEDRESTEKALHTLVIGNDAIHFENYCNHKDGRQVPVSWSAYWDPEEQTLFCIARDDSSHKESERLNQQLANTLDRLNEGYFSLDKELKVLYANQVAGQQLGLDPSVMTGTPLLSWYNQQAQAFYRPMLEKAQREGKLFISEHICPQTKRWTEVDIYPWADGLSVFFKDIEERKRSETVLRRLSIVAQQTVNAVVISDRERRVIWMNKASTDMSGYSLQEAIGQDVATIFDGPETDPEVIRYVAACVKTFQPFKVEALNYHKNGQPYWAEISCQPYFDEKGDFQFFFSMATDITERKRLQQQLDEQQKQSNAAIIMAQEKVRSQVGQDLHDNVNQVLTSVKLYQELGLSGLGNPKELMQKSADLLQASINEIRSLSRRLSAPTLGHIRLKDSIQELLTHVEETKKFRLAVDTDEIEELEVTQEVHLTLYRILQEHLTNVMKYSEASAVDVSLHLSNGQLLLTITDNGKGFNPDRKNDGIGLINMRTRAESLNGTLSIISAPGEGCELKVVLPLES